MDEADGGELVLRCGVRDTPLSKSIDVSCVATVVGEATTCSPNILLPVGSDESGGVGGGAVILNDGSGWGRRPANLGAAETAGSVFVLPWGAGEQCTEEGEGWDELVADVEGPGSFNLKELS
jgi:hypothetical protein